MLTLGESTLFQAKWLLGETTLYPVNISWWIDVPHLAYTFPRNEWDDNSLCDWIMQFSNWSQIEENIKQPLTTEEKL